MQPVQLRLGFAEPEEPVSLHLTLSGLLVHVEANDPTLAWTYLDDAGAEPSLSGGTLTFPARQFGRVGDLPDQVRVSADRTLKTLLMLAQNPSDAQRPAELACEGGRALWLTWFDGCLEHVEPVPTTAANVLLAADLPFVATPAAFEVLRAASALPLLLGTADLNHDGFIEITTSKPQMVELAPLPGLFRLDDTRFGLALPHADALGLTPGFTWVNNPPVLERGPSVLPTLPVPLSPHSASDLRKFVDNLSAYRAQAVVWNSGLGRRVFSLAAVDALDAWPVLIVCTPATLWAWQRHLGLFGRTSSLLHGDADAHLVTYTDLTATRPRMSPQTIIFDDLGSPGVLDPVTLRALRRLDLFTDAYRLAISTHWPNDAASVVELMSVLRPPEFRPGLALATRYPGDAQERLTSHVRAYISSRAHAEPGAHERSFRRSSVVQVSMSSAQREALSTALRRHGDGAPAALLVDALEIGSAGPSLALSPKVAAVASRVQQSLEAGRRVAVVTRHRRSATLIRSLVRATEAVLVEAASGGVAVPPARMAVVRFDRELPDLRWFDDVIVMDYPWSLSVLDQAVGEAADDRGPDRVIVVHLVGSVDDRIAVLASRRRELGPLVEQAGPPTSQEMDELLDAVRASAR